MTRDEYLERVRQARSNQQPRTSYEAYAQMLRMNQNTPSFVMRFFGSPRDAGLSDPEIDALKGLARSLGIEFVTG